MNPVAMAHTPLHSARAAARRLRAPFSCLTGTITCVATCEPLIALTFDDGPDPSATPRLLEVLARHDAGATFFMLGACAARHPELVREVAAAGHAIGNHSWDHPSFPLVPSAERRAQVRRAAAALGAHAARLFRPPYGHQSLASRLDLLRLGYEVVTWNVTATDWLDHDARWMADRVLGKVAPGSIVLFHDHLYTTVEDHQTDRSTMIEAVALILEELRGRFRFVTVPALLRSGRAVREQWFQRGDAAFLNALRDASGAGARRYAVR